MKNKTILFTFFFIQLFILFNIGFAQTEQVNKEVPITTSSAEARRLFIDGRDAMENAEILKARKLIDEAIIEDGNFALAYLYRAFIGGAGNFGENFDKAISLSDKISEGEKLLIQMYKSFYLDKNKKLGMEQLDKLIAMYPEDARLRFYKGVMFSQSRENDSAIVHLKEAVQLNPDYAVVHNILGYVYLDKKDNEKAENEFKEYIRLAPDRPNPYDSYADFLGNVERYDEAIENYNKAIEIDDSFTASLPSLGQYYIRIGNFTAARKTYQKFFESTDDISTKLYAFRLEKIISYLYEDKIDEALNNFKEYRDYVAKVNDQKEAALSYAYEGFVTTENGKTADGLKKFQEFVSQMEKLELPQEQKNNLIAHANLDLAYAYAMNNELPDAKGKTELSRIEADKKSDPALKTKYEWTLGFIEYKGGNYDKMIERMKGINGLDALKTYYLAQAYQKSGDKVTAKKLLKEARNANINSWLTAVVWKRINEEF